MMLKSKVLTFFLFLGICLLVFTPYFQGIGNYWDWLNPYFSNGWGHELANFLSVWREDSLGGSVGYNSWYIFQALMSLGGLLLHLPPEVYIVLTCVVLLALAAQAVYLLCCENLNKYLAIIIALAAVINPAIYYKLLAGHVNYLASYALFLYFVYFLLKKYNPKELVSSVILGVLLGLVGIQIQFFVFALIFLGVYFLTCRQQFKWKKILLASVIAILLNLPWLANYLLGVNSLSVTSGAATGGVFSGLTYANLIHIFVLAFSDATAIQYVYPKTALLYFGLLSFTTLSLSLLYFIQKKKQAEKDITIYLISLLIFVFFGTGYFNYLPIPGLKLFYPMLREVGHLAPLIVVFQLLLIARILPELKLQFKHLPKILCVYLLGFLAINASVYFLHLPKVNFENARNAFSPFDSFTTSTQGTFRVATYPFWNQYGLKTESNDFAKGRLINNSGWDNFTEFSGLDYINNNQAGQKTIENTLQYRLLKTHDISELRKMNIKYIFDYSGIYESNFENYTNQANYLNDLSLIKNDPNFAEKIIAANSGVKKVQPNILELPYLPRLYINNSTDGSTLYFEKVDSSEYHVVIKNMKDVANIHFLENFHSDWHIYQTPLAMLTDGCQKEGEFPSSFECQNKQGGSVLEKLKPNFPKSLDSSSHGIILGYANQWSIDPATINKALAKQNSDGSYDLAFTVYFNPESTYLFSLFIAIVTALVSLGFIWLKLKKKR